MIPQLLQEIIIDDLIEEIAMATSIDLDCTSIEFEQKYAELEKSTDCQGMNNLQLAAICDRELRLQQFKLARWGDKVETYFDAQGDGLDQIILSILQVEDAALAQELFFRVQSGEQSFAEIALDYSQGVHARTGGILGPLLLRELTPAIRQIVAQLKPGELSPLLKLDNYCTFFRLDEREPAKLEDSIAGNMSFHTETTRMHQFILDELFSTWIESQMSIKVSLTKK